MYVQVGEDNSMHKGIQVGEDNSMHKGIKIGEDNSIHKVTGLRLTDKYIHLIQKTQEKS